MMTKIYPIAGECEMSEAFLRFGSTCETSRLNLDGRLICIVCILVEALDRYLRVVYQKLTLLPFLCFIRLSLSRS